LGALVLGAVPWFMVVGPQAARTLAETRRLKEVLMKRLFIILKTLLLIIYLTICQVQ